MPPSIQQPAPIKVMHIASGDRWAGAEAQLWTLVRHLNKRDDVQARVVLMNEGETAERLRDADVPTDVLDESRLNAFQILLGLRRLMQAHRPDIIHTHRQKENVLGSLANLTSLRVPSVRTVHGAPEHKPGWTRPHKRFLNWADRYAGRHLQNAIVAVSDDLNNQLSNWFEEKNTHTIKNGVDIEFIQTHAHRTAEFLTTHPNHIHVGFVGRLDPVKRVDLFLDIAKQTKSKEKAITMFHVIGDGPLRESLRRKSEQLGLSDSVLFHGHRNNVHQYMASLDVMIICSDHEGLPFTALEALALGIKIVAHDVGGLSKLGRETNGLVLVKDHTANGYTRSLLETIRIGHRKLNKESRKNQIKEEYSARKMASNYANLYRKIENKNHS
ncbi:MAG: glycosyltransferase [Ectothiorhodospiraceae bacterium]|nr:glycosyltransferase [Ectothiorhodospiraceae bacterium]